MAISTAFVETNLVSAAATSVTITTGGQDATYPKANLSDNILGKPFRSTALTIVIDVDFGSAKAVDLCAILNHNVTAGATLIELKAGTTFPPTDNTITIIQRAEGMYASFTQLSKRYWRLSITNTGNTEAFIQIGELILGAKTTLSQTYAYGWSRQRRHENIIHETVGGTRHVFHRFKQWRYSLPFRALTAAQIAEVENIHENAKMSATPIVFVPDLADTPVFLMRVAAAPSLEATTRSMFASNLSLEEESSTVTLSGSAAAAAMERIVWYDGVVMESSGAPVQTLHSGVAVWQLPDAADSEIVAIFRVPEDADVSKDIKLLLNYAPASAPGVTNNKVKLKTTATVNDTAAAITVGDTITLANDTLWAKYTATANIVAGAAFARGDLVRMKILRDTTVANNAVVGFDMGRIAWSYVVS